MNLGPVVLTFTTTRQSKCSQGPDNPKDVYTAKRVHFPGVWIRAEQFNALSTRYEYLLTLLACETTVDGMVDAGRTLQGQVVQMHCRENDYKHKYSITAGQLIYSGTVGQRAVFV